jgi:hypothetical protein
MHFSLTKRKKNHKKKTSEKKYQVSRRCLYIDYRYNEDGRFSVLASCVTISNPDSLYSSETLVNAGLRS